MGVNFGRVRRGEELAILGAALGIVAYFLPWGTLRATSPPVIYGYEGAGLSVLIGSMTLVGILIREEYTGKDRLIALVIAFGVFGLAILGLADPTFLYARGPFLATPAIGAYVGVVGGLLCLVGTYLTKPIQEPEPMDDTPRQKKADA